MKGKIIVLSAPSGSGKSTIISQLMKDKDLKLGFSISATSRAPRGQEQHGKEYFFLTIDDFKSRVKNNEFVEWEEVYPGVCYGTLESEIRRVVEEGKNLVMDLDVKGALNIKKRFGEEVITIFIMPPDLKTLEERLIKRATDSHETIKNRLDKAELELSYAPQFDVVIVNDNLEKAVGETNNEIRRFISIEE
ncbi:MAG: guanylate kinase [Muribaculaceae bacterium]|nr:guanylate kinase [Muribaculaceae bacterium]